MELTMQKYRSFLIILVMMLIAGNAWAKGSSLLFKGTWGKEVNQLGIVLPSPGVLPVAMYQSIGGYDVDTEGGFWFSDSVNGMLKCYKDAGWSYIMLSYGKLGDIACFNKKIYVLTREPDGIAVIDPEKGKVEQHFKIALQNPGRIKIVSPHLFLIEEREAGLLIWKKGTANLHPATALEAAAAANRIFGVQFDFIADLRSVIAAEIADEVQEPEMFGLYEAGEPVIFIKTAGTHGLQPVIMFVTRSSPGEIHFVKLGENASPQKRISLPVLDGPYLTASWKLCSDGRLYGLHGSATDGFKVYRSDDNF